MKIYRLANMVKKFLQVSVLLAIILFNCGLGVGTAHAVGCFSLNKIASPAVGGTINANPLPNCSGQYTDGTVVTLQAVSNAEYSFGAWTGDATGSANPTTVTMSGGDKTVTASFPPANDDLASARVINSLTYNDNLNTTASVDTDATDPNLITCNIDDTSSTTETLTAGFKSTWWTYTPPTDQYIQADTLGSTKVSDPSQGWDTYVAIYHDSVSAANLVGCNDDYQNGLTSRLTVTLTANTPYYFEVAQFSGINGNISATPQAANLKFNVNITNVNVIIGGNSVGKYFLPAGQELRYNYNISSGPVKVESSGSTKNVAAIRLQSFANNTLYSFVETAGVPQNLLSYKYYFPTYNNIWAPLNSQLRFANLDGSTTTIRVTIGAQHWDYVMPGWSENRQTFNVNGGPVIVESLDTTKKIVATIRLQSFANNTLYSFAETQGIPVEKLSYAYYFPSYNNTWAPLDSQIRFANLDANPTTIRVTIGAQHWDYVVPGGTEQRQNFPVSAGPVKVESLDITKKIIAAIRLQSFANNTLYNFAETMGVPQGLLSYKYYFSSYNNTWAALNSQLRFANLDGSTITIRVTIGAQHWDYVMPGWSENRQTFPVSAGPVIVESLDTTKKIVVTIRLQSFADNTLYSFAETPGIPFEQLSSANYFPSYNNTWAPLNSQLRFAVP